MGGNSMKGPGGNNYIKTNPPPNYKTIFSQGQDVEFSLHT